MAHYLEKYMNRDSMDVMHFLTSVGHRVKERKNSIGKGEKTF